MHGLLHPVVVDANGLLLDGRNRLSACYLLGIELTEDNIQVTAASADAIANSNYARRHLTRDQRVMFALRKLEDAREKAKTRKAEGAKRGRRNRRAAPTVGAKNATNEKYSRRTPKAIEKVAKEEQVPRNELLLAEKLKTRNPELAEEVKDGRKNLEAAAREAGLKPNVSKKTRTAKRKTSSRKANAKSKSKTSAVSSVFSDESTTIVDRSDYIRQIDCGETSVVHHPAIPLPTIVYQADGSWIVEPLGESGTLKRKTKSDAIAQAIASILKQVNVSR
ncbi:hypothetical protein [Rhodopirellula sallentina]